MDTIKRRRLLQATGFALGLGSARLPAFGASRSAGELTPQHAAAHALNRLGFGPRPGDLASVAHDPRAWIDQQLAPGKIALPASLAQKLNESLLLDMDPATAIRELADLTRENRLARDVAQPMPVGEAAAVMSEAEVARGRQATPLGRYVRSLQLPAYESRLYRALESPRQLEEVMVDFWFNHFNVFQNKNFTRVLMGHYEHHAIRPFAMGRFRDLLGATAHHPAMLYYLDNWSSVGPQGKARGRGLNENYARELMELHTLGADGGYTQQDVTELARMLTGWTLVSPRADAVGAAMPRAGATDMPGFWFNPRTHDAGEKQWLGQRITAQGQAEGELALDVLARHPATARHIAFKLAQYFVNDRPDAGLVKRLAAVFSAQDGQIVPVLRALFGSDAFWAPGNMGAKFKSPYHFALSSLRAGGWEIPNVQPLLSQLAAQGMPLYGCQTPDGYKNTESAWLSPDGMNKRLAFATQLGQRRFGQERLTGGLALEDLIDQLGPLVTPATREVALQRRAEPGVAIALVLGGPGMMYR